MSYTQEESKNTDFCDLTTGEVMDITYHPGEFLLEELLIPLKITKYRLAKDIGVDATRIGQIIKGERAITADTALRLERYFRISAQFWLGLQEQYDLNVTKKKIEEPLEHIHYHAMA